MPFAPLFALSVPVVGAALMLVVALIPRLHSTTRLLGPAVTGLALLGVLATPLEVPRTTPLSVWHPSVLFGTFLSLEATPLLWSLALAATAAATGAMLVQLSRPTRPQPLAAVATLGFVTAVLGSLWGGNLLTVAFFWGWFDLSWTMGMFGVGASPRRTTLATGTNILATCALWTSALLTRAEGGSLSWSLMQPTELSNYLLLGAGLLRLGLYPLHVTLPTGVADSAPAVTPLFLGPVLGWGLLLRLTGHGSSVLRSTDWLPWVGVASLVAGGLLAWTRSKVADVVPWAGMAAAGAIFWAATTGGDAAPTLLAAGGAAWTLGVMLVAMGSGFERSEPWWVVGPFLGALALLGGLITPGVFVVSALVRDGLRAVTAGQAVLFLAGYALLTAGLARRILRPREAPSRRPLETIALAGGMALPALLLLTGAVAPRLLLLGQGDLSITSAISRGTAAGWALWVAAILAGGALFWFERRFRQRAEPVLSVLFDLVSLDWGLYAVMGGLGQGSHLVREIAELVEGAGAVLWAAAILLLTLLILAGTW
jgi:hypothetical protein